MNYPEQSGLPVELFCNFVDGKPHISSKHDHNKNNFFKSYILPYSEHYHPLPSVPQIKVIKAEASREKKRALGKERMEVPGTEQRWATFLWNKNWASKK